MSVSVPKGFNKKLIQFVLISSNSCKLSERGISQLVKRLWSIRRFKCFVIFEFIVEILLQITCTIIYI